MILFCSTCLSSDRKLIPLDKLKNEISINCEHFMINENVTNFICWECQAVFKKIHKFRVQAMIAHDFLIANDCLTNDKIKTIKCMSQLNVHTKKIYDATWTFTDTLEIDENTENTYMLIDNSYDDDDVADEKDYGTNIPKIMFGNASNITNNALTSQTRSIVDNVDPNIGNNISSNVDDNDKHLIVKFEDGLANVGPKPGPHKLDIQGMKLTKQESRFIVTVMTEEEMCEMREMTSNEKRYKIAPYKCVTCIKAYFDENNYQKHVDENHSAGPGKHKCHICGIYITRKDALELHRVRHYYKYRCRICNYHHHRLSTMMHHDQKIHDTKLSYPCDMCEKEFPNRRTLRYHKETVHEENAVCEICNKCCPKQNIKTHMMSHNKNKVPCPDCGKLYKAISLPSHRKLHSRLTDESAYCAECNLQFKDVRLYKRHLVNSRKHGGDVKYCDFCNKKYLCKTSLAMHIARIHFQNYTHRCHICKKGFMVKSKLKMHILEKHEGYQRPKDKLCSYCGKGFKTSAVLKLHIRSHTGERPNICSYCPAAFAQRTAMLTHCRALHPDSPLPPLPKRGWL